MLIAQRLEQLACRHDDSRRVVGEYLLDHANRFEGLSMADVAAETYTSKATLVRIAKQLGFKGWREFSAAYVREIDRQRAGASNADPNVPFRAGALPGDIAQSIAQVRAESTLETMRRLDVRDLERAADFVLDARRIVLMGYGFNASALDSFSRKLLQIGIFSHMPAQDNYAHVARSAAPGDCFVIVSYSGSSVASNLLRYLPDIRAAGAKVVGVTSEGENYLRSNADLALSIFSAERLYAKIGTFSTEASVSYLLDAVYGCVFARNYEANLAHKTRNSKDTERNRKGEER